MGRNLVGLGSIERRSGSGRSGWWREEQHLMVAEDPRGQPVMGEEQVQEEVMT